MPLIDKEDADITEAAVAENKKTHGEDHVKLAQMEASNIPAESPTVDAVTEEFYKLKVVEEEEEEALTFSIAGKGLKLDTAEDVKDLVEEIRGLQNLKKASFVGNTLGVDASKSLAAALDGHEKLEEVDLSDCFTGRMKEEVPVSVEAFGKVLVTKQHLLKVNFSDNAFGPIGAKALSELLSGSVSLQELILNNNGLGPEGGRIIAEALIKSKEARSNTGDRSPLRKVQIGRNRLENGSSPAFAQLVQVHAQLEEFSLPQCGIRSEGIITLSEGLKACKGLKTIDLQDNTFTTSGAKAFAEALPQWTCLQNLNIGDCMCEASGSIAVIKALCSSPSVGSLQVFNFQYNEMDDEGVAILADGLSKFTSIKRLMLNGNAFNPNSSAATLIKEKLGQDPDLLDEWSDMDFDEGDNDSADDEQSSGFITEGERAKLIVEADNDDE